MIANAHRNHIGTHFDSPPAEFPEVPESARERERHRFQAVLVLKNQLNHRDAMGDRLTSR